MRSNKRSMVSWHAGWLACLFLSLFVVGAGLGLASEHAPANESLGAATAQEAHGEHVGDMEGHGAHHGVTKSQVMSFIWHCLNFSILVVVLVKYLRKPISEGLRGRTESIRASFEELEAKKRDAERKYAEYEKKLSGLEAEAQRILAAFAEQGQVEKEKIMAQAKEAAERVKAQAELYVAQELAKARTQLQFEAGEMASRMAEELIRKNITIEDQHRLIGEYLERVVTKH